MGCTRWYVERITCLQGNVFAINAIHYGTFYAPQALIIWGSYTWKLLVFVRNPPYCPYMFVRQQVHQLFFGRFVIP